MRQWLDGETAASTVWVRWTNGARSEIRGQWGRAIKVV